MSLNAETIWKMLQFFRDDQETVETIEHALMLFESYHASIYELEIKKRLYSSGAMEADTYRERIMSCGLNEVNHNFRFVQ